MTNPLANVPTSWRTRYVSGKARKEKIYSITCPKCEQARWLKKSDALRAYQQSILCRTCTSRLAGRKGWASTAARWGTKTLVKHLQRYRLDNPSNLERIIINILDNLEITYEREFWYEVNQKVYLIDFLVESTLAIEVNGQYYHDTHHEDRDRKKLRALENSSYAILVLNEDIIETNQASEIIRDSLLALKLLKE